MRCAVSHSIRLAGFALLAVLLLTGCDHIQVALHAKVRIATLPVDNVDVHLNGDPGIAPGQRRRLIATFTDTTGKTWTTEGAGKGKILWNDIQVTPTLLTYKSGKIWLAQDPRLTEGKTAHIDITIPSHPALHAALDIPLRYNYPFVARYSGSSGNNGSDGTAGSNGSSGSPGSFDPDNPSAGGNGGDGGNGTDGTDGGNGDDGPNVTARIALRPGPQPMLEAVVSSQNAKELYYLIDPVGGSLTITSSGGSGGRGGKGGAAGQGGSGGVGSPSGSNGNSGLAGHDGSNGSDGSPGTVTITYDPSVAPYLSAIRSGNANAKLIEAPVPLLW